MALQILGMVIALVCWVVPSPVSYMRKRFERKDPIAYEHYRRRAMKDGHKPQTPEICDDDMCATIK